MEELIGRTVAGYEIMEAIGRGDAGVVYKAYRASLQLHVALKVLAGSSAQDPAAVARFHRQARSTARLRHPNIVPIHQIGQEGGLHYVAMDYIEGPSLAGRLHAEGPLSPREALAIVAQVGAALDFAHAEGVLHGKLKPANILLAPDGRAVLADFSAPEPDGTGGGPLAPPRYASPEQAQHDALDARSDLYSLGVVLYEMLTGRPPFVGDEPESVLQSHLAEPPPRPSHLNESLAPSLDEVLLRALHKSPGRRYQSAADLGRALASAIGEPYPGASRPSTFPAGILGGGRWLAGIGLVLVLAFGGAGILAGYGRPAVTPTSPATAATTATPVPSPTLTATATPSPTPTATVTATPVPTQTPTALPTPAPTETAVPPTAAPTRAAIPTPTLLAGPALMEPADGAGLGGEAIAFRWSWERALGAGEHFDLRVWRAGQPHLGIAWVQDTTYSTRGLPGGEYRWCVAVIREAGLTADGTRGWEPVSEESSIRAFSYSPPSERPTEPPPETPTKPPPPTPES